MITSFLYLTQSDKNKYIKWDAAPSSATMLKSPILPPPPSDMKSNCKIHKVAHRSEKYQMWNPRPPSKSHPPNSNNLPSATTQNTNSGRPPPQPTSNPTSTSQSQPQQITNNNSQIALPSNHTNNPLWSCWPIQKSDSLWLTDGSNPNSTLINSSNPSTTIDFSPSTSKMNKINLQKYLCQTDHKKRRFTIKITWSMMMIFLKSKSKRIRYIYYAS